MSEAVLTEMIHQIQISSGGLCFFLRFSLSNVVKLVVKGRFSPNVTLRFLISVLCLDV